MDSLTSQLHQIENLKGQITTFREEMAVLNSTLRQAEEDKKGLNAEVARLEGLLAEQEALKAQMQEVRANLETQAQALKRVREEKQILHVGTSSAYRSFLAFVADWVFDPIGISRGL